MRKIQFLFSINHKEKLTLSEQTYNNIKVNILNSTYKTNELLPSIRSACAQLSVSKSTIISAYFQLVTEGYITNIPQKGYKICKINNIPSLEADKNLDFIDKNIFFINDNIDKESFSRTNWKKYYNQILLDKNIDLTSLGDEQGEFELRHAISNFVRVNRGTNCNADQIIIGSGIQNLMQILISLSKDETKKVAIEDPGYEKIEHIFEDFSYKINKIPIKNDGYDIESIKKIKNSLIYTSPSYQYPLGKVMTIDKRLTLIDHAEKNNCYIIEDDYASTIRYNARPIASLQSLDKYKNTIYLGSFSKTFLPSLRISFMILPNKLLDNYYKIKSKYTHTTSKIDQLVLAKFISKGEMNKHLKKINTIYKTKNQIISNYIKEKYSKNIKILNNESGFHMVLQCKTTKNNSFINELEDEFLKIDIISQKDNILVFLFSYSGLENDEIPEIIDKLVKILQCE